MRLFTASMIGRLVLATLMFPTAVTLAEIDKIDTHQYKNQNVVLISQGNFLSAKESNQDRKLLALGDFDLNTVREAAIKRANDKRLERYQSSLDNYVPSQAVVSILVTGYSSTPDQTWGNPFITASGTHVHKGTMACPPQYPFGTKVRIQSMGTFVCEDRGGMIKGNHFDMWFESRIQALNWGKRMVSAEIDK